MATPTPKPTPARHSGPFTPSASGNTASPSQPQLSNKALTRSPAAVRTRAGTLSRMENSGSQQGTTPGSVTLRGSSPAPNMMGTPSLSQSMGFGAMTGSPAPGSVGMARGQSSYPSGLGIHGADTLGMSSDREIMAKNKIRELTEMLKDEWGYVSREGVVRAAERLQLETMWDTVDTADPGILSVAGEGLIVTITFEGWKVTNVTLGLAFQDPSTSEADKEAEEKRAGDILKKDLQGWDDEKRTGRYVKLIRFGQNMEYLATIDKYGKGGVSCLGAIDGIYRSLKRTQAWWDKRSNVPDGTPFEMLTSGCGWPRMHANGKVGLCLDYWLAQHASKRTTRPENYLSLPTEIEPDLYSMRIGVGLVDPSMAVQPIRVSAEWFEFLDDMPVDGDMDSALGPQFIPLQLKPKNPDATYLPGTKEPGNGEMELDGEQTQKISPHVLFKACFEPPIPIGTYAAVNLLHGRLSFDAQATMMAVPYGNLILPELVPGSAPGTNGPGGSGQTSKDDIQGGTASLLLSTPTNRTEPGDERYNFNLTGVTSLDAPAVMVHDFPFSHPMELLTVLPTFRMWAWMHSLFTRSFGHSDKSENGLGYHGASSSKEPAKATPKKITPKEYRALLKAGITPPRIINGVMVYENEKGKDKEVAALPKPTPSDMIEIQVQFDQQVFSQVLLDIVVALGEGKDPVVAQLAVNPGPQVIVRDGSIGDKLAEAMAKVLLQTEDFGVMARWVRTRKAEKKETI